MEITLIRHTSVDVPRGVCYGQTDVPLRDSFFEEAALTKQNLGGAVFNAVYTSPLTRSVRLADFCGYPNAIRDNRLKEMNFGEWEMQPFDTNTDPHLQEWYEDYLNQPATGGESFAMVYQRVSDFLDELKPLGYQKVAIFAHGGVLVAAQVYAGYIHYEEAFQSLTPYGGIIRLLI